MANQGHATNGIRLIREWYEAGLLGNVTEVIAWFDGPDFGPNKYFNKPESFPPVEQPVPSYLDWDLWLGACCLQTLQQHLYSEDLAKVGSILATERWADWCCHTLDAPFWTLDLGMPDVVEAEFKSPVPDTGFISDKACHQMGFPHTEETSLR